MKSRSGIDRKRKQGANSNEKAIVKDYAMNKYDVASYLGISPNAISVYVSFKGLPKAIGKKKQTQTHITGSRRITRTVNINVFSKNKIDEWAKNNDWSGRNVWLQHIARGDKYGIEIQSEE